MEKPRKLASHPIYRMLLKLTHKELRAYILSDADAEYREWALDLYVSNMLFESHGPDKPTHGW